MKELILLFPLGRETRREIKHSNDIRTTVIHDPAHARFDKIYAPVLIGRDSDAWYSEDGEDGPDSLK
jgi:hypothetical protein